MGDLVLVRHGQARTFEEESDQLTALGEDQARALGRFWIRQPRQFDEIYCGTLVRQRRTAEITGACFAEAGLPWPELQTTPELNEYDSKGILGHLIPELAGRDAMFRKSVEAFQQNKHLPDRNRYFQKMFEAVISEWMNGTISLDGVESWQNFCLRVRGALNRLITSEGSGRRIAVFTSGGVIGLAVQTALRAPDRQAIELNWRVRNCSLTEFVFSKGRISLDSFNAVPHLDDPKLRTYR